MSNDERGRLIIKYQNKFKKAMGGIFTPKTRKRLLGTATPYGGEEGKTLANFWYRTRTYVSNALVDLELFLETADKKQIDQVITAEAIEPILKTLLWKPVIDARSAHARVRGLEHQEIERLGPNPDKSTVNKIYEQTRMQIDLIGPDANRAEISQLLIHYGFRYLQNMTPIKLLEPQKKLISDAMELSDNLTQYCKPEAERRFPIRTFR